MVKLTGDHDVFGDGSVTIVSTPGHTPGHQSLLVRLPQTGVIVLSGDFVHFRANFDARRAPSFNFNQEQSLLDIVPFGGIERADRTIAWPPDHVTVVEILSPEVDEDGPLLLAQQSRMDLETARRLVEAFCHELARQVRGWQA
jgi:hypothetical protein